MHRQLPIILPQATGRERGGEDSARYGRRPRPALLARLDVRLCLVRELGKADGRRLKVEDGVDVLEEASADAPLRLVAVTARQFYPGGHLRAAEEADAGSVLGRGLDNVPVSVEVARVGGKDHVDCGDCVLVSANGERDADVGHVLAGEHPCRVRGVGLLRPQLGSGDQRIDALHHRARGGDFGRRRGDVGTSAVAPIADGDALPIHLDALHRDGPSVRSVDGVALQLARILVLVDAAEINIAPFCDLPSHDLTVLPLGDRPILVIVLARLGDVSTEEQAHALVGPVGDGLLHEAVAARRQSDSPYRKVAVIPIVVNCH